MKRLSKAGGLTLALLLTGHASFASHMGPIISDEALILLLLVLVILLIGSIASFFIAAGNIRRKSTARRIWSFILSLPMLASGILLFGTFPVAGFILMALVITVWVLIFKSMSDHAVEE